jgi:hypothetical protein
MLMGAFSLISLYLLDLQQEAMHSHNTWHRNAILVEQAREDAMEIHKASKIEGLRKHARKVSAKFGGGGKQLFEGDLH